MLFKNKEKSIPQLLDKVNMLSFIWLKTNYGNFILGYHSWWLCPFVCLDID